MYFYLFFLYWRRCSGALTGIFVFDDAHGSTRCLCSGHSISETNSGKPAPSFSGMRGGGVFSSQLQEKTASWTWFPLFPESRPPECLAATKSESGERGQHVTRGEAKIPSEQNHVWRLSWRAQTVLMTSWSNNGTYFKRLSSAVIDCHRWDSLEGCCSLFVFAMCLSRPGVLIFFFFSRVKKSFEYYPGNLCENHYKFRMGKLCWHCYSLSFMNQIYVYILYVYIHINICIYLYTCTHVHIFIYT